MACAVPLPTLAAATLALTLLMVALARDWPVGGHRLEGVVAAGRCVADLR
jgi:hypothetical protein